MFFIVLSHNQCAISRTISLNISSDTKTATELVKEIPIGSKVVGVLRPVKAENTLVTTVMDQLQKR